MNTGPIGVFDSGIGGLTVIKHMTRLFPNEDIIYFGDTARVPYGTRSHRLIKQYALEDAAFLQQFNIKYLIIACNSVSAVAVDLLHNSLPIPVTGVISPGVTAAVKSTKNNKIGIIGTTATVNSKAYENQLLEKNSAFQVYSQACPLLVPLVEEGWISGQITELTVAKYLKPLIDAEIDTLILGCTHYPVIADVIQKVVGHGVKLIDSGEEAAKEVKRFLQNENLNNSENHPARFQFFVSDIPYRFNEIGTLFLGKPVVKAEQVDFDSFLMQIGDKIYSPLIAK